jgi:hypothetical protein
LAENAYFPTFINLPGQSKILKKPPKLFGASWDYIYYSTYINTQKLSGNIPKLPPKKYNHSAKIFSGILQNAQIFRAT